MTPWYSENLRILRIKIFGRIPGFAGVHSKCGGKIFLPTWSERGAVDPSVITAVSDRTRRRRQSVSLGLAVGESVQVLARLGGAWYAYRWLLPPNSLSLDHASAPPGAYLQSDGNFC